MDFAEKAAKHAEREREKERPWEEEDSNREIEIFRRKLGRRKIRRLAKEEQVGLVFADDLVAVVCSLTF